MNPENPTQKNEAYAVELMAVKLLAGREFSRQELRRRLKSRHPDRDLVESVLDALEQRELLSDERFAANYVDQRMRKGFGPLRIGAELAERGIKAEVAVRYLDEGSHDWHELLSDAAVRRFGDTPAADRRTLAKRGRFLEQRGFPISLVRRYLDRIRDF